MDNYKICICWIEYNGIIPEHMQLIEEMTCLANIYSYSEWVKDVGRDHG